MPYLQLAWPYQADRNVLGSAICGPAANSFSRAWACTARRGSRTTSTGPIAAFEAELAIDEEAGRRGSVVFRVLVDDGRGIWNERATSEVIRGGQPPVPISVDLAGAKRLSLLVDYADRADELDHADWLNARLVR